MCTTVVVEAVDMVTGGTDTECVWLPPLLERGMHDIDRKSTLVHIAQTGCFEYLAEVPAARRRAAPRPRRQGR